jgi:N-carbamoyl-L-amino-acid hydrolase
MAAGHADRQGSHTGSTPMPKRRNAGLGMARVTELVHEVAMDYQPTPSARSGTWRSIRTRATSSPGNGVHHRHPLAGDKEVLDEMDARIRAGIATICEALDVGVESSRSGISTRSPSTRIA